MYTYFASILISSEPSKLARLSIIAAVKQHAKVKTWESAAMQSPASHHWLVEETLAYSSPCRNLQLDGTVAFPLIRGRKRWLELSSFEYIFLAVCLERGAYPMVRRWLGWHARTLASEAWVSSTWTNSGVLCLLTRGASQRGKHPCLEEYDDDISWCCASEDQHQRKDNTNRRAIQSNQTCCQSTISPPNYRFRYRQAPTFLSRSWTAPSSFFV